MRNPTDGTTDGVFGQRGPAAALLAGVIMTLEQPASRGRSFEPHAGRMCRHHAPQGPTTRLRRLRTEPILTSRSLHWPSAAAVAMLTAALANLAQLPQLEVELSDWYEAVNIKPGHELPELVGGHFDSTRTRFELYLQLRDLAPHAVVTMPAASEVPVEHLVGLAAASEVVRSDEPLIIDAAAAAALEPSVVASGVDLDLGDYVIALPSGGQVEELLLVQGPDRVWIVEAGLLAAARDDT